MKNYKTALLIFLALALCLSLTACGKAVPGKKVLVRDIMANDYIFKNADLQITSFEITQRQTRKNDMKDYVWVTIRAENRYGAYDASYKLTYELFNDGWKLSVCSCTDRVVTPNSYPTEKEVLDNVYESGYAKVTVESTSFINDRAGFILTGYKDGECWNISRGCTFSFESGWSELTGLAQKQYDW